MSTTKPTNNWSKMILAIRKGWSFVSEDVWKCHSNNIFIHIIKTINLSVRCFLNEMLQQRASALTFRTLLAIVPALVVLIAIGKGAEEIRLTEISAEESHTYYRTEGVHCVPKVKLDDLIIK